MSGKTGDAAAAGGKENSIEIGKGIAGGKDGDGDIEAPMLHQTSDSRREDILAASNPNSTLINALFPRDPKAIGSRRYVATILLGLLFTTIFALVFTSTYLVSVQPIQQLMETGYYKERTCEVVDNSLFQDVSFGVGTTWRGELRVIYNTTKGVNTPFRATVYDTATGQLGTRDVSVNFLRKYPIGTRFVCLVNIEHLPFRAAIPGQQVLSGIIVLMTIWAIIMLGFAFFTFRSCYNFYKFRRYYTWNADLSLWSVSSGAGRRQASLPP